MNFKVVIAMSFLFLSIVFALLPSQVRAATITVEIGGDPSCTRTGVGTSVAIAMSCPATNPVVTIEDNGGPARVEILGTDTNTDILRITNTRIIAKQALNNFHIVFYRDDPPVPDTAIGSVFYKLKLNGFIPAGNSLTATGFVAHPVGSAPVPVGMKTVTGPFNTSASAVQWTQALNSARLLMVDMKINLAKDQVLNLANWVQLNNQASADRDQDNSHIWLFSTTGQTTNKLFGKNASLTEQAAMTNEAAINLFIHSNWASLSQEVAQGRGEHLGALASLLSIPQSDHVSFFRWSQERYADFSNADELVRVLPQFELVSAK